MKRSVCVAVLLGILLFAPIFISGRHIGRPRHNHGHHHATRPRTKQGTMVRPELYWKKRGMKQGRSDTLQVAGSSLPDCSHACGSCTPCRLVMVSFVCASLAEAETCPIAYKCMCHNKSYPVP
ncbi:Protein Epidermal patterning factor 1 [Vitis vinifera]|uniref:Epidermal patterning factor-like protein n=1 Tax=Vitis vinifera TaxID=29760 RepID=A0A438JHR0_VITVI|nr:Protein Epidermal patterning factor 1 [Vitis vinifera]